MAGVRRETRRTGWIACAALLVLGGCQHLGGSTQQAFDTPEAAVEALFAGLERDDQAALLDIFGREHEETLVPVDWAAGRETRETIAREGRKGYTLQELEGGGREIVIGAEEWPFPMPLVKHGARWRFDTEAGLQEVVDRRVGRNELAVMEVMHAYVDAQIEYAKEDRDGDGLLEYAQKLASSDGKRDGLYWKPGTGEPESPLGPLVVRAERYLASREPGDPIYGYYFKILTGQGANAQGGARDYRRGDDMITGFAAVAYPAEYGNSGIMTFVVDHRGRIQEKDLGEFRGMDAYDPDDTWRQAEE